MPFILAKSSVDEDPPVQLVSGWLRLSFQLLKYVSSVKWWLEPFFYGLGKSSYLSQSKVTSGGEEG